MAFDKTLFSSLLLLLLYVQSLSAASTTKLISGYEKAGKNLTRSGNTEVNNFPVNGLPPLTYSSKKYTFYNQGVSFFEAWNLCRNMGKRLAAIESYQDYLTFKEQAAPYVGYLISHWIAANNLGAKSNEYNKFYWITNDRPVGYINGYQNWLDGVEPNEPDQCVAAYLGSASWIYGPCAISFSAYACEESQDV